jgi:serine/threonine-protein kinase
MPLAEPADAGSPRPSLVARSGRFSVASLFRLGSVPGSPEEVRSFVQARLRTYLGFMAVLWSIAGSLGTVLSGVVSLEHTFTGVNALRSGGHVLGAASMIVLFACVTRGRRSSTALAAIDLIATVLQGVFLGLMVVSALPIVQYRPEVGFLLGITYCMVARAAVVPSTASRTVFVSILASLPVCAATLVLHTLADRAGTSVRFHYPGDPSGPVIFTLWAVLFSGLSVALTGFVSHVIYGLHREVERALQLGSYTLEAEIGAGGMGIVYRARHALLRRPTAVKLLPPERAGAAALARFEREVQLTSQLTHPNTVAIYDYGRTPQGVFYYAMEFLDGLDLQALVEADGPQPAGRVLHVLRQIGSALAEAHGHGLIHRDVKPSNIVLCERGLHPDMVKVVDFGLARDYSAGEAGLTQATDITGTPYYMSPEQIVDPEALDGRSDLYALGALGYFLITGQPVFDGRGVVEVCAQHLHSRVVPPSARITAVVPAKLEAALLACLEKDRGRRPESAEALLALLDACDDCPPWTPSDARRWWRDRAPGVRAHRPIGVEGAPKTLNVARRQAG